MQSSVSRVLLCLIFVGVVGGSAVMLASDLSVLPGTGLNAAMQWPSGSDLPYGSYQDTCKDIRMDGDRLEARCRRLNGDWNRTSVDSHCRGPITNENGVLTCNNTGGWRNTRYWQDGAPDGDYRDSCQNVRIDGDHLRARCRESDGDWRDTSLDDYRQCKGNIVNRDGHLRCDNTTMWQGGAQQGDYRDTCQNVRTDGDLLRARCRTLNGEWRDTAIDYHRCQGNIVNNDGNLLCDGSFQGDRSQGGVPQGPYTDSCQNIRVEGDDLRASCQMVNGQWRDTSLDEYGRCRGDIINDNGALRCSRRDGDDDDRQTRTYRDDFRQSCRNIQYKGDDLHARCQKADGSWRDTSLDEYRKCTGQIVNEDGHLRCRK